MHKFSLFILVLFSVATTGYTQRIDQDRVRVDHRHRKLIIPYHIQEDSSRQFQYHVRLFFSQDAGKNYEGPLEYTQGHVGEDILAGSNKVIVWDYFKEKPNFFGQNVRFKIWATYKPSVLNLDGPQACLRSAYLPGLGNNYVRFKDEDKKWKWVYVAAPTYLFVGTGIFFRLRSDRNRQRYLEADNRQEAEKLFDRSEKQRIVSSISLLIGGAIWAADILQVAWKGCRNQKEKKRVLEKNEAYDKRLKLSYKSVWGVPGLSLSFHY